MLVFMVTKDDFDRYGIWKTFLGSKQPSLTQMLEFGKWAVFKPIGLLMQATIIDFNTEDDALESTESIELSPVVTAPSFATAIDSPQTPPPPPPPPPPPAPATKSTINEVEPRCKKLSWKELNIDLKNTIWEKVNRQLSSMNEIIDKNEVIELFREKPRKSRKYSVQSPAVFNSKEIQAIAGKKQLNISIALAHHQLTADSLLSAVQNVDIRLLEPDFISSFESILPDQNEEGSLFKKFSSENFEIGDEVLTDPEVFSYLLSRIPDYRKKIRAMVFQCSFYDRVNAICKNLDIVREASKEIRRSSKLQIILMYILSVGRIINNTSTKAFNIDFIGKASCFKTSDGETNFLMYLVQKLTLNDADVLALSEEFPSLQSAAKVSLNDVDRDSTELAVEYASIALELDSLAEESKIFKEFVRQGKFDLNHLKRKRRQVQNELKELTEYFGIATAKSKPMEVFSTVKQFLKDLSTASENVTKKALSRRNSSKTIIRSTSTTSFKRGSRNSSCRGSRNSSARSSRNSSARSSFRRAFRNVDIKNQDEKDCGLTTADDQCSSSSKSSSPRVSRSSQRKKYLEGSASTRAFSTNSSSRRSSHSSNGIPFDEDPRERPKEPDLEKYKSLMKEYEEKRKSVDSSGNRIANENSDDNNNCIKSNNESLQEKQLRLRLLSPVREHRSKEQMLESSEGALKVGEIMQNSRTSAPRGYHSMEYKVDLKDQNINSLVEMPNLNRGNESGKGNECIASFTNEKSKESDTLERQNCQQDAETQQNEAISEKRGPYLSKHSLFMNEKPIELTKLHYKAKNSYETEVYGGKEANIVAKERVQYKRPNEELSFHDASQRAEIDDFEDTCIKQDGYGRRVMGSDALDKQPRDKKVQDYVVIGKQNGTNKMIGIVNGIESPELDRMSCWREVCKAKGNNSVGNEIENCGDKSDDECSKGNRQESLVRGAKRNSFSMKRSLFRNSTRRDRGIRKVSVKAIQAKDIEMMSSRSASNFDRGDLHRRRTNSEGVQAVKLKTSCISKNMPMKLEVATTSPSQDEGTRSQKADNQKHIVAATVICRGNEALQAGKELLKEGSVPADESHGSQRRDGPVLRRTKSAVINQNLREAKLIFLL